jgi:serine/threonine-protein kinase
MDFGIARALSSNAATVTQTAAVIGTAQYLSPEQARGEPVDARSDVYSTGCLLYELITGQPPFVGDSPVAVAYQHVRENAPAPSSLNPEVPRALDSIVMKALAKNPLNRYQSAGEMRADLQRALADRPVEAEAVMTDQERTEFIPRSPAQLAAGGMLPPGGDDDARSDEDERRRKRLIWTAIVVVLLLVIGAAAYAIVLLGKNDKPKKVAVPPLVGQTVQAANAALVKAGFQPDDTPQTTSGTCTGAPNGKVKDGLVCTQDPPAGSMQTKDTVITFFVYKTPTVQVPNVVGMQYAAAAEQLAKKGLRPVRKDVNNDAPAGQVIAQNPAAYAGTTPNGQVLLSVSTGKTGVPNEVGKKVQDALSDLSAQGWTNVGQPQQMQVTDKSQDGVVIQQYPTPGSNFPKNQEITLTVGAYVPPSPTCTTPTTSSSTSGSTSTSPSGGPTSPGGSTTPPNSISIGPPNNLAPSTPPGGGTTPTC